MNDIMQKIYQYSIGILIFVIILILSALAILRYGAPAEKIKPYIPIKEQILTYPYKDNSPTLKAAEARVIKKIDKIIQRQNSTCSPNGVNCGAIERRITTTKYHNELTSTTNLNKNKRRLKCLKLL